MSILPPEGSAAPGDPLSGSTPCGSVAPRGATFSPPPPQPAATSTSPAASARRMLLHARERQLVLERELPGAVAVAAQRVLAREAGVTVRLARLADGLVDAGEREVVQRVAVQLGGDLLDRAPVGDHLLARRHVDAVVARVLDRRRRDAHVYLRRAGVAQHADDLARRVAAPDRVVDDDEPLAADDLGKRVELQPQAVLAQLLAGLDERPRDVAVLDEAVVLRQPGRPRHAARRRVAGVGHRDDEVGVDRRLAPQDLAHPPARGLQDVAAHPRVGPREVDVLEDAERLALALDDLPRGAPA